MADKAATVFMYDNDEYPIGNDSRKARLII